jgi:hypothetical protein
MLQKASFIISHKFKRDVGLSDVGSNYRLRRLESVENFLKRRDGIAPLAKSGTSPFLNSFHHQSKPPRKAKSTLSASGRRRQSKLNLHSNESYWMQTQVSLTSY